MGNIYCANLHYICLSADAGSPTQSSTSRGKYPTYYAMPILQIQYVFINIWRKVRRDNRVESDLTIGQSHPFGCDWIRTNIHIIVVKYLDSTPFSGCKNTERIYKYLDFDETRFLRSPNVLLCLCFFSLEIYSNI
jgi:hypothetical protein